MFSFLKPKLKELDLIRCGTTLWGRMFYKGHELIIPLNDRTKYLFEMGGPGEIITLRSNQ